MSQTQPASEQMSPGQPPRPVERPHAPAQGPPVTASTRRIPPPDEKDGFRELMETIVFVVVLVLLLKTFLAEAFVIPTGSMATTLLGYHKDVVCEKCGYHFEVNAADEAEGRPGRPLDQVLGCVCPNCRYVNRFFQGRPEEP